ncbi:MFS family permease [Bacillus mesophilus]|uniref:MFS transporter n=1 Tax=Bacillus mesophilus TaxID=1808955 RepID=A0A6M0Q2L0_9BACI|nr:MFS transporter [Bacillus mesophilus]MBM7659680.1 MFS family permease [Bacillus mesophilus]NEY70546.1 MFS transporter [Bacillus mesophilus]
MAQKSFKTFLIIWFGQLASVIGSGLTSFSLGVWVFQETGSVTLFSFIIMSAVLPGLLASPIAGYIVDKYKRKTIMIAADCVAGFSTLVIFILLSTGNLEIWHIFVTSGLASFSSSFQLPAYQSTIALLVPKKNLGRANGMVQMADSLSMVVAPLAAGLLLGLIGLNGIILIDFISFFIAITTLIFVKFPELTKMPNKEKSPFLKEAMLGWSYIQNRPALVGMLVYFAFANFLLGYVNVLIQPLILTLGDEKALGMTISIMGVGMLLGGILMSLWGGMQDHIKQFLLFGFISAIGLSIAGMFPSVLVITIGMFISMSLMPFGNAASQTIWQRKVHPSVQGRVFALRRMIALSLAPIAYITAGPVTEKVFNPLMVEGGLLAGSVGAWIGVGDSRGIGLLFLTLGVLWAALSVGFYLHPRIRNLENEVPDAIDEESDLIKVTTKEPKTVAAEL